MIKNPYNGCGLLERLISASSGATTTHRRPVVGIAGFYGYGNYGDELFLKVFAEYFSNDFSLRILPDLPGKPYFSTSVDNCVKEVDAILVGGGDLVQPWAIDSRYFNKAYLEKPVFVVGVGVPIRAKSTAGNQVEKPFIVEKYREFFRHKNVRFIHARDQQSAKWIEDKIEPLISVTEAPDIVCALSLPQVTTVYPQNILGIVTRLRPGHEGADDYSKLEELGINAIANGWRVRHIILGNGEVGQRDRRDADRLQIPGKEIVFNEELDVLTGAIGECSCLASMKFHGSVVATMYGVPSIVLIPTSKNRNFMRRIDRGDLLSKFDSSDLPERFKIFPQPIAQEHVAFLRERSQTLLNTVKDAIKDSVS